MTVLFTMKLISSVFLVLDFWRYTLFWNWTIQTNTQNQHNDVILYTVDGPLKFFMILDFYFVGILLNYLIINVHLLCMFSQIIFKKGQI